MIVINNFRGRQPKPNLLPNSIRCYLRRCTNAGNLIAGGTAITLWNAMMGEKIATVHSEYNDSRMKFTPDGRYLIIGVKPDAIKPSYR